MLEAINLTKKYHNFTAVDDFNMKFNNGIYGLLGPNGAGKTTLINMIVGNLKPTNGNILFNGVDINKGNSYRDSLGYLPQKFGCRNSFTTIEFLEYIAALKGIGKKEFKRISKVILEQFNLVKYSKRKVHKLSGGTKRRLGIAQAIINNPDILILDEPTAGLDPEERINLRNFLLDFAKNKIVIVSTHIIPDIESLAENSLFMKESRLIKTGDTENLVNSIENKVWEDIININDYEELSNNTNIVVFKPVNQNNVFVRYVSDNPISISSEKKPPTLEDAYLYYTNSRNTVNYD